jgi:hypothetical protein
MYGFIHNSNETAMRLHVNEYSRDGYNSPNA